MTGETEMETGETEIKETIQLAGFGHRLRVTRRVAQQLLLRNSFYQAIHGRKYFSICPLGLDVFEVRESSCLTSTEYQHAKTDS